MSQIGHTFGVAGTTLFLFLFGNPARNGSYTRKKANIQQIGFSGFIPQNKQTNKQNVKNKSTQSDEM